MEFVLRDDTLALEGDESFTTSFEPPVGINPGASTTATVTIIDDDGMNKQKQFESPLILHFLIVFTIQFTEEDYSYNEGQTDATVCLEGDGEIAQPARARILSLAVGTAQGICLLS